jgi:hypothetical protein
LHGCFIKGKIKNQTENFKNSEEGKRIKQYIYNTGSDRGEAIPPCAKLGQSPGYV